MKIDRQSIEWARTYKTLLADFTRMLGGDAITPARAAIARNIAVMQCELALMANRFAASGRGASAEELQEFLKISSTVAGLMESVGLAKPQEPIPDQREAENDLAFLRDAFQRVIGARLEEESRGVFRDKDDNIIDASTHVLGCACEPCQWRRDNPETALGNASTEPMVQSWTMEEPEPHREPLAIAKPPPPPPVLRIAPTPDRQPLDLLADGDTRSTTQKYYDWVSSGGLNNWWGPV
jgi:hypothetical protein